MTLTVDLAELRTANEKALAALSRTSEERFDTELAEIENFLLSLYRFVVLAVRNEQEIERAAEVWRETLDVIDGTARQVQTLAARHSGVHPSLDRILEIRHATSDVLALYQVNTGCYYSSPASTRIRARSASEHQKPA